MPPLVFVVVGLVDLLYPCWVHTRLVGRLGWFDRVFCSPSNQRVHHGQNDYCIDRNDGGLLIVWDRLFGTFAQERDSEPHHLRHSRRAAQLQPGVGPCLWLCSDLA